MFSDTSRVQDHGKSVFSCPKDNGEVWKIIKNQKNQESPGLDELTAVLEVSSAVFVVKLYFFVSQYHSYGGFPKFSRKLMWFRPISQKKTSS